MRQLVAVHWQVYDSIQSMALGYNMRSVWFRASHCLGWNVFFVGTWWLIGIWSRWRSTMIAELDMCWLCSRHVKMSLKCLCNVDWSLKQSVFCVSNVTKLCGIGLVCTVTGETRVAAPAALNLHLISKLGILAQVTCKHAQTHADSRELLSQYPAATGRVCTLNP